MARRGEGIAAFRVPAVYIATVTNAALWALNILRFLQGSTAGTSSQRSHRHAHEIHYTSASKASYQILKISSPKNSFLIFCPFSPSRQMCKLATNPNFMLIKRKPRSVDYYGELRKSCNRQVNKPIKTESNLKLDLSSIVHSTGKGTTILTSCLHQV